VTHPVADDSGAVLRKQHLDQTICRIDNKNSDALKQINKIAKQVRSTH